MLIVVKVTIKSSANGCNFYSQKLKCNNMLCFVANPKTNNKVTQLTNRVVLCVLEYQGAE